MHPETDPGALVAYFGYGSLVNRDTHRTEIVRAVPARLKGWRRHWVRRDSGTQRALLSVRKDPISSIDGLLIVDRMVNLPALDQREQLYRRVALEPEVLDLAEPLPDGCSAHVYEAADVHAPVPLQIIQSYLDAVMQGFYREFGHEGLLRFLEETDGFEATVLKDRAIPAYPRAVRLDADEETLFDALLMQKIAGFASFVR